MSASTCPRPHRRQLIDIANEQQRRPGRQGAEHSAHQRHVDHRGLVDDQQVAVERRLFVAPKAAGPRIGFEQAMDRLRPEPGALSQAFRGTAGRGAERDSDGLREKDLEDGVDQGRLADARTAGDHQHLGNESNANSLSLAIGESQLRPLLDPWDSLVGIDQRPGRPSDRERLEPFGNLPLSSVKAGEEDASPALKVIGDYGACFELMAERCFDELCWHFEQRLSERDQLFGREPAMPFVHRFGERA